MANYNLAQKENLHEDTHTHTHTHNPAYQTTERYKTDSEPESNFVQIITYMQP